MKDFETSYPLLNRIDTPSDLRKLPESILPAVCEEIRQEIIDVCAHNPGHLGSSLGAVELAVALQYIFNTPEDHIVWDVGHQAYAHKILTGRRKAFYQNRKSHGLKPFPSPQESPYDVNTCGHASNSISIALGLAVAEEMQQSQRKVVAVIGDGAMSGGLAYEGLNNVSSTPNDLLIILNDNNMSISGSVGGMKQYLLHLHTSNFYNTLRFKAAQKFSSWGILNDSRRKKIIRFNNSVKSLLANQQNIFEGLNIRYFGPIDGNNIQELVRTIREIKDMKGPRILHVHTVKGKGFSMAEKEATIWHAPGKFDPVSGQRLSSPAQHQPPKFQDIFGDTLVELGKMNEKIVGITPAMLTGCSMDRFQKVFPKRTFDVGIAEGHAVTFAAGMAIDGMIPFCNIYSSFAQRAYDNIIHDVAISGLHVVFCLDRAGLVGEDGPTHHGAFDIAALRPIPNLTIASPMDGKELRRMMFSAQLENAGPYVIRYPRGRCSDEDWQCPLEQIETGKGRCLKQGTETALLTLGPIGNLGIQAIKKAEEELSQQGRAAEIAHYDMRFVKPLDNALLDEISEKFKKIIVLEDGVKEGGFGSAVLEYLSEKQYAGQIVRLGYPDRFISHGTVAELQEEAGIDITSIKHALL
ncbi:MAG: 1-deoxy-D-xylulose-5-phosphate synthase [Bacteroidaceae bacterium]|nr:1-deoxy-D-xylulose-5-phosphate synthase [Bacteroidaceae bacterium]